MTPEIDEDISTSEIAWRPGERVRADARLTAFLAQCDLCSGEELRRRAANDVGWFTEQVLRFLDVKFDPPYSKILDTSDGPAWAEWCVGGGLNITEFCLDRHANSSLKDAAAVIWEGEEGNVRQLTYAELLGEVGRCAAGLRRLGVRSGERVAIHLPMMPETVVALLAINRIGAIAVPVFSGYGETAIAARVGDVEASVLITCDAFPRRGAAIRAKDTADRAAANCPSVRHVVVVRRMNVAVEMRDGRDVEWADVMSETESLDSSAQRTAAEDALIVLYTSGTTGKPKGIVHSHCGFPIKAAQDMAFGTDVGPRTRITWVTDIGWMMGPWLIYGATLLGATIILYDGAPDYPKPDRLWEFCARHQVEALGISPTLVRALSACGDDLPRAHDLSRLRLFASTGEPWNPAPWWWLFREVGGERVPIINYSGGTEISGGILMGDVLSPVKPCSFPSACPGIDADVVDEEGRSLGAAGAVGELVIRQPWIGMARGFWKDSERYLQTYWSRFPNIWVHGDWASRDAEGHWYIHGRSDDTLKVAGKRVGPAEVESILVGHRAVTEAAVIGVPDELKNTKMIAFCVRAADVDQDDDLLATELRGVVARELGKPLRPEKVIFVSGLPKTRNAKIMRRVIRAAYLNQDAGDLSALENPALVEQIRQSAARR